MNIKIKKLRDNAKLPYRGSEYAAGYDVTAAADQSIEIAPQRMMKIGTGLAFELPKNYFMGIYPRSGLATKRGLRLANCVGVLDADYRGELIVPIYNDSNEVQIIEPGERIAQIIFQPYEVADFEETNELSDTERGTGGFGSTGIQ